MYKALGTLLQRATQVSAYAHTGVAGNNNAILWTAVEEGTGSSVTVDLQTQSGTKALDITVTVEAIVVKLATTGGVIITTATQLIAAILADNKARLLVTPENYSTSTGAGLVVVEGPTSLTNGSDTITWTTVAEVGDISGPALAVGTIDTTNHSSTSGWREYVTTVKDGGQVSFPISFDPQAVTHEHVLGLVGDYQHNYLRNFKVIFTDTGLTPWLFSGYVVGFVPAEPVEGKLSANVTIKISGATTLS